MDQINEPKVGVGSRSREQTWTELEALRPALRAHLARRCRDANDIEDVIQETLLRAARYRGSLTRSDRLLPWVLRISVNVLSDAARRSARLRRVAEASEWLEQVEAPRPSCVAEGRGSVRVGSTHVEYDVLLEHLREGMDSLKEADREVLRSYYGGAQSCQETAAECAIPPALVKVRLFRARDRLRRLLKQRVALHSRSRLGA